MNTRIRQYRRSFKYEIERMGFRLDYRVELNHPIFEFEADTLSALTDDKFVRLDIHKAASAFWGIKSKKMTTDEVMSILDKASAPSYHAQRSKVASAP